MASIVRSFSSSPRSSRAIVSGETFASSASSLTPTPSAARAMRRLEAEAERIAGDVGTSGRSLRLVSAGDQFSALIRRGKTTIQIAGDTFSFAMEGER